MNVPQPGPLGDGPVSRVLKPEILIVPSTSASSGVVSYVREQVRALSSLGPKVAAEPGSHLAGSLSPEIELVEVGPSAASMAAVLRRSRSTVVHTHGPRPLLAARRAGVASWRIHHLFHELPWKTSSRGAGEALLSVGVRRATNSPASQRSMSKLGLRIPVVLPPIVSAPDCLSRAGARERLSLPRRGLLVGVVGRLHPAKSPLLAVDAVALWNASRRSRAEIVFVGEGPNRSAIKVRAEAKGVMTHLLGEVQNAATVLRAFDAVAMPSPQETFGLVMAEAALAGVPIAAVASPGASWILEGSDLLRLASPEAFELAAALERALDCDANNLARLTQHVADRFGDTSAEQHLGYFEGALEEGR